MSKIAACKFCLQFLQSFFGAPTTPFAAPAHPPRQDVAGTRRVVPVDTRHKAGRIVLHSQRVAQRAITKTKLSLEINGLLLGGSRACSIRTVWTTKIAIASLARRRRDAYEDEVCLASEAQQDEAAEKIPVDAVDPFITAPRVCVGVERDRIEAVA